MVNTNNAYSIPFGQRSLLSTTPRINTFSGYNLLDPDKFGGSNYKAPAVSLYVNWSNPLQRTMALGRAKAMSMAHTYNLNQLTDSFKTGSEPLLIGLAEDAIKGYSTIKAGQNAAKGAGGTKAGGAGWGIAGAIGGLGMNIVDNLVTQTKYGKKQTTGGAVLNTVGDAAIATGNPYAIVGGIVAKGVGTVLNLGFGNTFNEEGIQDINNNNSNMRLMANGLATARNNADYMNTWGNINLGYDFDQDYVGDQGWWSNKVTRKFNRLKGDTSASRDYVAYAGAQGAKSVNKVMNDNTKENTIVAFGGPIDIDPSTAIGYQMYTDKFMSNKLKESSKMSNLFAGMPDIFSFGGGIQSNGANFNSGISYINSGGTHEENPLEGVQMGVDSEGVPNLVEEGEVKWNDYIFSNRLIVPRGKRGNYGKRSKKFAEGGTIQLGGKANSEVSYEDKVLKPFEGLTFADAAKKIIKRNGAEERDDAITLRGVNAQLSVLAGVLEKERQKEQLREMEEAIDSMSPEEFAMLQQLMEAQQAAKQQLEQAAMQLLMIPQGMEQMVPLEQQMTAFGGPIYNLGGLLNSWEHTNTSNKFAKGGFGDWWYQYVNTKEPGVDYGAIYKSITGEDAPTDAEGNVTSRLVYDALALLYAKDSSIFKPYDATNYKFIDDDSTIETPAVEAPEATVVEEPTATTAVTEPIVKQETIEGPMAEVLKYKDLTAEQWNALSDKTKERYLKQYRHSLNKTNRQAFDTSLNTFNKQQEYKRKIEEHLEALRKSFLTKDDLKNFDLGTLDRLAKFVNPNYTPADTLGLSENERKEAHDKLLEDIATWSKDNNKTLADINAAFSDTPELYKDWKTVDYSDPDTWTSKGYDLDEFTNRTAAYNGSQTAGNLIGNYAPDAEYNKDVFSTADTIDNIEALEADPTYKAYTDAVKAALARNAGIRYRYKEGTNSDYENLEFADEDRKISKDDYDLLHLFGRLVARTKTNPNGDPVPFFVRDGDYNKINEKITKDGKEYTPEEYLEHLRNDLKLGAMHLTPKELKARDLYQVKGTDLYHTLEQIGGAEGDWRNYYDISEPVTLEDGTRLFTLTPKKGIKIDRTDSLPEGITISEDGTIVAAGEGTENDPFPTPAKWPWLVGAGLLAGALGYNMLTPPNYDNADALIGVAHNAGYMPISFSPIGHYLTYRPFDRLYQLNMLNANARATDRAILNSGVNQGTKDAALLANAYANQIGAGNLFRLEQEFNEALRKQTGDFNKDTDKFNSEGILKADMADQDAYTRSRYSQAELLKAGYAMRQAADDARANAINAGISGLATLASNYGLNKYNQELLGWGMKRNAWGPGIYRKGDRTTDAKGGRIRRKRGIGF